MLAYDWCVACKLVRSYEQEVAYSCCLHRRTVHVHIESESSKYKIACIRSGANHSCSARSFRRTSYIRSHDVTIRDKNVDLFAVVLVCPICLGNSVKRSQ